MTANPGAYALVGMGTAFAGIVRTPLTSVIMIFEMTRDYSIIVPLMISNLISFFVSQRLQREPIYEALALQEGVHLPAGESREHLSRLQVSSFMQSAPELDLAGEEALTHVHPDDSLSIALEKMGAAGLTALPVVSRANLRQILGIVTLPEILKAYGVKEL